VFVLVAKRRTHWRELDEMVNTVNQDWFLDFAPGCLRVCDLYVCRRSDDLSVLLEFDVGAHADFSGPYLGTDQHGLMTTECVCAFPRRRFTPHFGLWVEFDWATGDNLEECCESMARSKLQAHLG
jgi:hypothetical protein